MTDLLLVHGAFRGAWAWGPVVQRLDVAGVHAVAIDLPNAGARYRADHPIVDLDMATDDLVAQILRHRPSTVVGHSQGALVVRSALAQPPVAGVLGSVGYLDGAVPDTGACAADLLVGVPASTGRSRGRAGSGIDRGAVVQPPEPDPELPPAVRDLVRGRATPQHAAIAFDPVGPSAFDGPVHWAFASRTPPGYPSTATRECLDARGIGYTVLEGCHDLPLHRPSETAHWLIGLLER